MVKKKKDKKKHVCVCTCAYVGPPLACSMSESQVMSLSGSAHLAELGALISMDA